MSFFNHMVGIKTTGEQISILCHNGTIFDKPREKLDWLSTDTLESERIQNRPPPCKIKFSLYRLLKSNKGLKH